MWDKMRNKINWFSSGNLAPTLVISALLLAGTLTHMFYYELRSPAYNFGQCLWGATVSATGSYINPSIRPEPLVEAVVFSGIPVSLFLVAIFFAAIRLTGSGKVDKTVSVVFLIVAVLQMAFLSPTLVHDYAALAHYYENADSYRKSC